jgi:hypothetical protein
MLFSFFIQESTAVDVLNAHVAKKRRRAPKPARLAAISVVLDPRTEALNAARTKAKNKKSTDAATLVTPVVDRNPRRDHLMSEQTPHAKVVRTGSKRLYRGKIITTNAYPTQDEHVKLTAACLAKAAELFPVEFEHSK